MPALDAGAEGIESQAQGGGGGIVDALINRAVSAFRGIVGGISSGIRSAATAVGARVRSAFTEALGFAKSLVSGIVTGVKGLVTGVIGEVRGHFNDLKNGVRGLVGRIFGAVRGVMGQVGGAVRGAIAAILSGQPVLPTLLAPFKAIFGGIFSGITGQIQGIIERIRGVVNGVIDRLVQAAASFAQRIVDGLTSLGRMLTTATTWLVNEVTRLGAWLNGLVAQLPGFLRDVITSIVNRVVSFVQRLIARISAVARSFIERAINRVISFVRGVTSLVTRIIDGIRGLIGRVIEVVAAGVRTVAGALERAKTWLVGKVSAFISRVLRTILSPIVERLKQRVLRLIGPAAADAIRRAQLMFPNGMPTPPEVVSRATEAAQQVGAEAGEEIIRGLTNPEGDHISFGIQIGASGGEAIGGAVSTGANFDIVLDYRRNDIGFFISPMAGGQVNIGDVGGVGDVAGVGAWGTVGSFGNPDQDVLGAYGGWFTNATYGVQAGLAVEGGAGISSGGSFYRGGATSGIPVFSYTPLGADSHPVPGTGTPGTTTPGTPDTPGTLPLGEVHFPRQVGDVEAAPGGPAAVDHAGELVRDYPGAHPGTEVTRVDVLGEASRVWQRPGAGQTRAEENAALAERRAQSAGGRLRGQVGSVPVTAHGNGDLRAAAAGKPETDASPEDQRASMVASTLERGTPGSTTPGTPPTTAPNQHTVEAFSLPNPFQRRQAWGWDTTVGVAGYAGAEAKAGVYGGIGVSYSFPIGKTHLDADTMRAIRITVGILKLAADAMTLSPLGFIRDALGLAAMAGEHDSVAQEMTNAVTDWAIPMPPGVAVG